MPEFNHLGLFCSIDRIGPLDTRPQDPAQTGLGFGLSLSASFVPAPEGMGTPIQEGEHVPFFFSWNWRPAAFAVWARAAGGPWSPIPEGDVHPVLVAVQMNPPPAAHPLLKAAESQIRALASPRGAFDPATLLWDPFSAGDAGVGEHIRNLLAVLSTRATPVPHALGLSYLVRVTGTALDGFDEVAMVPVFGVDSSLGERLPLPSAADPAVPEPPATDRDGLLTLGYQNAAGKPALLAYLLPEKIAIRDSADLFLDFPSGWMQQDPKAAVGGAHFFGKDWTVALEGRAAEGFDLAQRLIDFVREAVAMTDEGAKLRAKLGEKPGRLIGLRHAVLAATRDLAGAGLRPAADGVNLVTEVRRRTGDAGPTIDWTKVETALAKAEGDRTLAKWAALVKRHIPEIAGVGVLTDPETTPRPIEHLADELAELERLQSALADESNLRRLVIAQWREALGGELAPAVDALERHLDEIPLRLRLARANLGPFWRALVDLDRKDDERTELGKRIAGQLERSLVQRFFDADDPPVRAPRLEPTDADSLREIRAEIVDSLTAFANRLAGDALPRVLENEDNPEEGDGASTPVPHGITLQLDRLGAPARPEGIVDPAQRQAELDKDREDLHRNVAGFGVLLREAEKEWRCLNMSRPVVSGGAIHEAAIVPYRLGYRDGMRETAVTYDNHPLVAKSPATGLATGFDVDPGDHELERGSLLGHDPVIAVPADDPLAPAVDDAFRQWSKLPALQFGRSYEALPFAIFNTGVLPRELASDGDPTWPRKPGEFKPPAAQNLTRKFRYLRRVRVGPPRYGLGLKEKLPPELLAIPSSVAPIGREVKIPDLPEGEQLPLLLLSPPPTPQEKSWLPHRHEFAFPLRKPAVDINTWDRWLPREEANRQTRIDVFSWYYQNAPKELGRPLTEDLTIDDPALEGFFRAVLTPVAGHPAGAAAIERDLPIPAGTATGDMSFLNAIQSGAVQVTCAIAAGAVAEMPLPTGSRLMVKIPQGQVWELRIHPVLRAELFTDEGKKRFHPNMAKELEPRKAEGLLLVPPFRLLVEVATDGLAGDHKEELWAALEPRALGSRLDVRLDVTKIPTFAKWISRAEVRRQVWRWNGRPLGTFPFAKAMDDPDGPEVRAWEAKAFAEREDGDCARSATAILLADPRPRLYEEDRANDARALLYRFGVEVFSRYAGLGAPTASLRAEHKLEDKVTTPWRRLVHRCRWTEEVPKPRVKLVVPLTETRKRDPLPPGPATTPPCGLPAKTGGAAGLLVVLNEPWYEIGGLAEDLRIDLDSVEDPTQQNRELPQIGPDPILTGDPWKGPQKPVFSIDGPIGHTFDTDSSAPLFVSTSFVVPAPALAGIDLSWNFAKVRFRRRLDPAGCVATLANGGESKPTDPFWVQFLPDASTYTIRKVGGGALNHLGIEDLEIERQTGGAFRLVGREGREPVSVERFQPLQGHGVERFFQVLLVTRLITDAGGKEDEKYVGLYRFDGQSWLRVDGAGTLDERWDLRARVVEMQERTPRLPSDTRNLWDDLFPEKMGGDTPQDALLRIVRVSTPIDSRRDS